MQTLDVRYIAIKYMFMLSFLSGIGIYIPGITSRTMQRHISSCPITTTSEIQKFSFMLKAIYYGTLHYQDLYDWMKTPDIMPMNGGG